MLSRAVALDWSLQQMEQEEKEAGSLPVGRYKGVEEKATVLEWATR
jgi:hypothetical protein